MSAGRHLCLVILLALGLAACQTQDQTTSASEGHLLAAQDAWQRMATTPWQLARIDGAPSLEGSEITLNFPEPGRLAGNGGANSYFAGVERTGGDGLKISPIGATQMYRADPPGVMDQEGAYFKLLNQVDQYRVQGGRLQLLSDGRIVLEFLPKRE